MIEQLNKLDEISKKEKKSIFSYPPPQEWVFRHPTITNHTYIPISIVENVLDFVYKDAWSIMTEQSMLPNNSILVKVQLILGGERRLDGVAAIPLTEQQGIDGAFQLAKSLAIRDAAGHLGKLLGRDLGRPEVTITEAPKGPTAKAFESNQQKVLAAIDACTTVDGVVSLENHAKSYNLIDRYNERILELSPKQ